MWLTCRSRRLTVAQAQMLLKSFWVIESYMWNIPLVLHYTLICVYRIALCGCRCKRDICREYWRHFDQREIKVSTKFLFWGKRVIIFFATQAIHTLADLPEKRSCRLAFKLLQILTAAVVYFRSLISSNKPGPPYTHFKIFTFPTLYYSLQTLMHCTKINNILPRSV